MTSRVVLLLGFAALLLPPSQGVAQSRLYPRWEIPGFDFRKDGAWRVKAQRVAEVRRQLRTQGRMDQLNAPLRMRAQAAAAAAVTGTLVVPALLFSYQEIDSMLFMRDTAQYSTLLFGPSPPVENPYTLRTYYEEMSNGLFSMQGEIMGWVRLDGAEDTYTGTPGTCNQHPDGQTTCNGIFSSEAIQRMQDGFREALARVDTGAAGVDFSAFDNDGPDLVPNSVDDDGYVDMIMFAYATGDGFCGGSTNNHIWSHRFFLGATGDYVTNDASAKPGFGNTRVSDYFASSALGGAATLCDSTRIMAIGAPAHEFGHALGLPDLYDQPTGGEGGIGQWGLMGSGGYTSPSSPSRMEAWSLNELGWVTVAPLDTTGTYSFGAAPVSDTAFLVEVQGSNTRDEYFLLENRQASEADTALIRIHCQNSGNPPGCGGGLLIWHADGAKLLAARASNLVNTGTIHGLALMQADGANHLRTKLNRGDAGDLYPGTSGNTAFALNTNPAAVKNLDGSFVGFEIDSIRQVVAGGALAFRLRFGSPTFTTADVVMQLLGPGAPISPGGVQYLDSLGNDNGGFDVGDFLAWVKATGAPPP